MQQCKINDRYLKLAISLKTNELKRTKLSSLTYQHVESTLIGIWKHKQPDSLHDAVEDIMSLQAEDVVAFLSTQAVIIGSRMKLDDFHDLFGGDKQ